MDPIKIHKLVRSRRRTVALVVGADATLTVRAPMQTPIDYIESLVRRKSDWIKSKIREVEGRPKPQRKRFANGESFLYLGDLYRLRVIAGSKVPLVFQKEFLLARENQSEARSLLLGWYKEEAAKKIPERVRWYALRFGMELGPIKITDAKKRWGSCGKDDGLNFSWRLILAPLQVIDYVVIHELAHTVERNHGSSFWRKVASMCPTYQSSVEWLRKNEHLFDI